MKKVSMLGLLALALSAGPSFAANVRTDAEILRDKAEHVCYDDVQKICQDAVPDEDKIKACMKAHRAQLSAPCRNIYNKGIGG